jgi:hypothetical protein
MLAMLAWVHFGQIRNTYQHHLFVDLGLENKEVHPDIFMKSHTCLQGLLLDKNMKTEDNSVDIGVSRPSERTISS